MIPVKWTEIEIPEDFKEVLWHGDKVKIHDVFGVMHPEKRCTIIKLELTNEERRQLIDGNPIYLSMIGRVIPFMASVNLGEITETIRSL